VPVVGRTGQNVDALRDALDRAALPGRRWSLDEEGELALDGITRAIIERL